MNKIAAITALLAVVLLLTAARGRAAEDTIDLQFRFEKGQEYKLVITVEQNIVQWLQGDEVEVDQTIGIGETFKITDVTDDGTAAIEITFGPMAIKMAGPMGEIDYDSEDPPEETPPEAKGFEAMLGRKFTMKVTPKGHITEIKGVVEMIEAVLESIDMPDGQVKDMMAESMKRHFGEDALKEMMENALAIFPEGPVAVGDSWSQEMAMSMGFPVLVKTTYTLAERKDGTATLGVESTLESNPDAKPMQMGPMTIKHELEGTQKGTLEIDEATGWYVASKITQELEGEMIISGAPGQAEEMSLPITIKSTITLKTE